MRQPRTMTRKEVLEKGGMLAGGVALSLLGLAPRNASAATSGVALGVHAGNVQWGSTWSLDTYSSLVNRKPAIISVFQAFYYDGAFRHVSLSGLNTLQNRYPGSVIMLTFEPRSGPVTLDSIIAGTHDGYIRGEARTMKAFGKRLLLRPFHEMNIDHYPWGKQNPRYKLINAWRKLRSLFNAEGAWNVEWVWCPNVAGPVCPASPPLRDFYPGDAYVDWLGLDGYNWGGAKGMPWYQFNEIFRPSMNQLSAFGGQRKVIIAEVACDTRGGDKAVWMRNMRSQIKAEFPRIWGVCYFNIYDKGANWPVNTSSGSLTAYKGIVADPYYQVRLAARPF